MIEPAWYPIPAWHGPNNNATETAFLGMVEQATAQGQQVVALNRGKPGHSTFPNAYRALLHRLPGLHYRVAYALRQDFVVRANCAMPLWAQNTPFTLDITALSGRALRYTELINVHRIVNEFLHNTPDAQAERINDWDWEETCARTAGCPLWLANVIRYVRGRMRNRIRAP